MSLTSHERYTLYKHCLKLGVPEDIAVKIRENSYFSLQQLLKHCECGTEIENIIYSAFSWHASPDGHDFWDNVFNNLITKQKGEIK